MAKKEYWPIRVLPLTLIGYICIAIILACVLYLLHDSKLGTSTINSILYTTQIILTLALLWGLKASSSISNFMRASGLEKTTWQNIILLPIGMYCCVIFFLAGMHAFAEFFNIAVPGLMGERLDPRTVFGNNTYGFVVSFFAAGLIAPLLEEILFRGIILNSLLSKSTPWIAILISAVIFAGIHLQPHVIIPLMIQGIALGWLFYRTQSIYPALFYHIFNNTIAVIVFFLVPQTF